MKWWRIKSDEEVYQSENGDCILVHDISDTNDSFDYELRLVYNNCSQEIKIKTTISFKEIMIKMLKNRVENKNSDLEIFLK
jgi:hypothetical protein